ncbi:MAG: cyclic nucleotide-binding domain-containing protein [Acidobacteriota bacterium]
MQTVLFILGQLNDDDVEWLIAEGVRAKYPDGARLIEEGQPNEDLFILLEGHVSISVAEVGEVAVAGSGEILGEMTLVDSRPPSATVTAIEDCYALRLPHEALRRQVEADLGFGMRFYRALATFLSQRLRSQRTLGFDEETGLDEYREQEGELDVYILDQLHVAGARFDRLLKKMMRARAD